MAKVMEVICVPAERGRGTEDDPSREVTQLWTKGGQLICELDHRVEPEKDAVMEALAKLPEDVKKMALAYAHGVSSGRRMQRSESGTTM